MMMGMMSDIFNRPMPSFDASMFGGPAGPAASNTRIGGNAPTGMQTRTAPNFGSSIASASPSMGMGQSASTPPGNLADMLGPAPVNQTYGGPTPMTQGPAPTPIASLFGGLQQGMPPSPPQPAPALMPQMQAMTDPRQRATPTPMTQQGPGPVQPPPFLPPAPMPFMQTQMPQFQQPNFSYEEGRTAVPDMPYGIPSMKGLFGVR